MTYFILFISGIIIGSVCMSIFLKSKNKRIYGENIDDSESQYPIPPRLDVFYDEEQKCWVEGYQPIKGIDTSNPPKVPPPPPREPLDRF